MSNFRVILAALAAGIIVLCGLYAHDAGAQTSAYMYPWPTSMKQVVISSCSSSGGDPISCGCYLRKLRERWTFAYAVKIGTRLTNGDVLPASAERDISRAVYACMN